ncbi:transglutaminase-like cysteine peptidase [Polaromonas sp.]|uniref:transglutaminase-like cysteine peptidase n=1 Tax=Polaromonas sp. TaxID=1869339 RepID=UPI00375119DD
MNFTVGAKTTHFKHFHRAILLVVLLVIGSIKVAALDFDRMQNVLTQRFGAPAAAAFTDWQKLLQQGVEQPEPAKLKLVNDFFNRRIRFQEDLTVWAKSDYWATPMETLGRGAGDCEDFAIVKYFTLLLLGIPDEKLRLIYVQARIGGVNSSVTQAHMVLAFYPVPDAEPMILDNLINDLRPASRRPDLLPVFSFNSQGLWQGASGARGAGGPGTLSRWQELLNRARAEGFD